MMSDKERAEVGFCENCSKPIYDGEEYHTWGDSVTTHKECPAPSPESGDGPDWHQAFRNAVRVAENLRIKLDEARVRFQAIIDEPQSGGLTIRVMAMQRTAREGVEGLDKETTT